MFGRLGWAEILIIVVLLVILFGSRKIPGMMKNLADGINVFKNEMKKSSKESEKKSDEGKKDVSQGNKKVKKTAVRRVTKKKIKK